MKTSLIPENLTLIIADAPAFRGIRQRVQQLALRLAPIVAERGGQLWYLDEPGNLVTVFLSPEKPLSNLWSWMADPRQGRGDPESGIMHFVPPAGLPFGYHSGAINRWNHFWYRAALGNRFRHPDGPVVLIVCNVLGLGWLGRFGEDAAIYDCADEISEFRQAQLRREAVEAQEGELIGRVDAVVTTSQGLYDAKSPLAKRANLIRNAAEIEHFNKTLGPGGAGPPPDDIAHLEKPIVGFYGYLADWLDWPLIETVVREGKEFDWVFIGPTTRNLSSLEAIPNFHALGRKPYDELPSYLGHFACAHIPFARTRLTQYVNPVKLYEYLAAGVPVVATPLPELEAFRDVCALAETPEAYLEAIRQAVESGTPEKRQSRAVRVVDETWENRVEKYLELIADLLAGISRTTED